MRDFPNRLLQDGYATDLSLDSVSTGETEAEASPEVDPPQHVLQVTQTTVLCYSKLAHSCFIIGCDMISSVLLVS